MPFVTIEMYEGRTLDQRRALAKNVTNAIVDALKVAPEAVEIKIVDLKKENVARGGTLAVDR
jgi:4-oxalocrotonate tautomerase